MPLQCPCSGGRKKLFLSLNLFLLFQDKHNQGSLHLFTWVSTPQRDTQPLPSHSRWTRGLQIRTLCHQPSILAGAIDVLLHKPVCLLTTQRVVLLSGLLCSSTRFQLVPSLNLWVIWRFLLCSSNLQLLPMIKQNK